MKKRSIKMTFGLLAVAAMVIAIYLAFGPTSAWACNPCECAKAGGCYTQGDCVDDYVCSCTGDCSSCSWIRHCPPKPAAQPRALLTSPQGSLRVASYENQFMQLVAATSSKEPRQASVERE